MKKWSNQGGGKKDDFNQKKISKLKVEQTVKPLGKIRQDLQTSPKIIPPRKIRPIFGEFGDNIEWVFEDLNIPIIPDDLELPQTERPISDPTRPIIILDRPESEEYRERQSELINPSSILQIFEVVIKWDDITIIAMTGQAFAARNNLNDRAFDSSLVLVSPSPIAFFNNTPTNSLVISVDGFNSAPSNNYYIAYKALCLWITQQISIATDGSGLQPDPLLSALNQTSGYPLPPIEFQYNFTQHGLFGGLGLQPTQICLSAINDVLEFESSDRNQLIDFYNVLIAGDRLAMCLSPFTPPVIERYRFIAVITDSTNYLLAGFNIENDIQNLISPYNQEVGFNIIDPDSTDRTNIDRRLPLVYPDYSGMYWKCAFFVIDMFDDVRLQSFNPDGTFLETGILDYFSSYELRHVGLNKWASSEIEQLTVQETPYDPSYSFIGTLSESFRLFSGDILRSLNDLRAAPLNGALILFLGEYIAGGNSFYKYLPNFDGIRDMVFDPITNTFIGGVVWELKSRTIDEILVNDETYIHEHISPPIDTTTRSVPGFSVQTIFRNERLFSPSGNFEIRHITSDIKDLDGGDLITTFQNNIVTNISYQTSYYRKTIAIAGQSTIYIVRSVPLYQTETNLTTQSAPNGVKFTPFPYSQSYRNTIVNHPILKKCFIGQVEILLSPIFATFLVDSSNINPGSIDLISSNITAGHRYIHRCTHDVVVNLSHDPDVINGLPDRYTGNRTRNSEYFCQKTPFYSYLETGFFVIISSTNILNCRVTNFQDSDSVDFPLIYDRNPSYSSPIGNINQEPSSVYIASIDIQLNSTIAEDFTGFDAGRPMPNDPFSSDSDARKIDSIAYSTLSNYSHAIPTLVPPNQSQIKFVDIDYFSPENTIVANPTPSEPTLIAYLFKSYKADIGNGIVETWVIHTSGWLELIEIKKLPLGQYNDITKKLYYYPGGEP